MALTQISTKGIKDGTITGSDLATNVDLVDNQKLRLGTGQDLEIYHDGSNSYLKENGTGGLYQQTNGNGIFLQKTDGENMANFVSDGAVELYHDNSKRFETTSGGGIVTGDLDITGTFSSAGNIKTGTDTGKFFAGASNDLQIYHDGSHSFVDGTTTGDLYLRSTNDDVIVSAADDIVLQVQGSETALRCNGDGAVELYFNNVKQIETLSNGVRLKNGHLHLNESDNMKAIFGASDDLQIYHDGSNSYIYQDGTGELRINTHTFRVMDRNGGETQLVATEDGAVELYYDNSKKFETTSSGVQLGGDLDTNSNHILLNDTAQLKMGASDDFIIRHNAAGGIGGGNTLGGSATTKFFNPLLEIYKQDGTKKAAVFNPESSQELYFNNSLKAFTHSSGWRVSGSCFPNGDGNSAMNLGLSNERWHTVFAITGTINTSDEREKTNINATSLGLDFINKLKPVTYNWKDESRSKKLHYGLVVQDIIKVLEEENIELNDFGAINDEGKFYGLNYSEFISPLIKAVQELSAEVAALKAR